MKKKFNNGNKIKAGPKFYLLKLKKVEPYGIYFDQFSARCKARKFKKEQRKKDKLKAVCAMGNCYCRPAFCPCHCKNYYRIKQRYYCCVCSEVTDEA